MCFAANLPEDVAESAGKVLETGIYYGWASVGNNAHGVKPMVMSYGWNPYYKNEKRSAVCSNILTLLFSFGLDQHWNVDYVHFSRKYI